MTKDFVNLTSETLVLQDIVDLVKDDGSGAITTFNGTTRHTFKGKLFLSIDIKSITLFIFFFY
jgi:hypothetical protein